MIEKEGTSISSEWDELETPLINGADCAYVIFDNKKTALCGIEEAYNSRRHRLEKTSFLPPISNSSKRV